MLQWHSLKYKPEQFFVKGTELNQALAGANKRYALIEVRCYDKDRNPELLYRVRDAATVSDEQVLNGVRPKVVFESLNYDEALNYCINN